MLPTALRTSSPEPMDGNNPDFDDMPNAKSSRDTTGDTLVNRRRTNRTSILPVNREDLKASGVLGRSPPPRMLSDLTRAKAEAVGHHILCFAHMSDASTQEAAEREQRSDEAAVLALKGVSTLVQRKIFAATILTPG